MGICSLLGVKACYSSNLSSDSCFISRFISLLEKLKDKLQPHSVTSYYIGEVINHFKK